MADKYSTIQQYQPLRVPAGWGKQERALIVQLEEVLDDIYRRFGRLRMEDMGEKFQSRIADDEGNISQLNIDVGQIELQVADKYDKVSGITINSSGIDISGSKYVKIESGCELDIESGGDVNVKSGGDMIVQNGGDLEIKTGGTLTVQSGNFAIDSSGNATFKGGGEFSGALSAATGTFAGTMSAACVTSGTMSAERINGGTLTVGGNGNGNGQIVINNASGNEIGRINNDGYEVNGDLNVTGSGAIKIKSGSSTKMQLDSDGIDMKTSGKFYLHANDSSNSAIIFGTDKNSANFYVGQDGDLVCKSIVTTDLSYSGSPAPRIVVSETEPTGSDILWFKPSSTSEKQWAFRPSRLTLDNTGGTLGYYYDFTCPYAAADYLSGDLYYGIFAKLYFYNLSTYSSRTFKARLQNGGSWIDLGSVTDYVQTGRTLKLDTMLSSVATNVMNVSGGNFTIRLETNAPSSECMLLNEDVIIKAKNTSTAGASACSVYYKA